MRDDALAVRHARDRGVRNLLQARRVDRRTLPHGPLFGGLDYPGAHMIRPVVGSAVVAAVLSFIAAGAIASEGLKPSKASQKTASTKAAAKPAAAEESAQPVTQAQLDIAGRVMTGNAQCEFNQQVSVQPIEGKPAHFKVGFKNVSYTMVPEETTTGAVRLEDKRAGVVWVQIPAKSMLLNAKAGQRMVNDCRQSEQRAAL
jgi:hypothetical protein